MDYYLNEYSLRGQFRDLDEFYDSLRNYTLPVLKKVHEDQGNVIWKKDTFWQSEICNGISLENIPKKKNERFAEGSALKIYLRKLANEGPFWSSDGEGEINIKEYLFDLKYSGNFHSVNCFSKAVEKEGRILSFLHHEYKETKLSVIVQHGNEERKYEIDNIYALNWWVRKPQIKTWRTDQGYVIEVRAKEPANHSPHFHVSHNEFLAAFDLNDGKMYANGKKKLPSQMISEIFAWYQIHRKELKEAWESLHRKTEQ